MSAPAPTARYLVVNADDFGLSVGVNAGIIGAFRRGLVRSASLLVTTPGFDDALILARAYPDLDLGIHLALTGVRPALPPERIPSLVGHDGRFPSLVAWQWRVAARRLRPAEVQAELRAQVARARRSGLTFTHLDGHHHIHLFWPASVIVADLARELGGEPGGGLGGESRDQSRDQSRGLIVRRVQEAPCEAHNAAPAPAPAPFSVGEALKRGWLGGADRRWGTAFATLPRTDAFRGVAFPTSLARWRELARSLPIGVSELMCHPGLHDATVRGLDPYVAGREAELRWLCDPRVAALLRDEGVTTTSFRQLLATG